MTRQKYANKVAQKQSSTYGIALSLNIFYTTVRQRMGSSMYHNRYWQFLKYMAVVGIILHGTTHTM